MLYNFVLNISFYIQTRSRVTILAALLCLVSVASAMKLYKKIDGENKYSQGETIQTVKQSYLTAFNKIRSQRKICTLPTSLDIPGVENE